MERVRQTPDEVRAFENSMVADLRATAGRYPDDPGLAALLADLRRMPAFAALWDRQLVAEHLQSRKVVVHPEVGEVAVDCDVLATQRSDLRVVVFTPQPGADAAAGWTCSQRWEPRRSANPHEDHGLAWSAGHAQWLSAATCQRPSPSSSRRSAWNWLSVLRCPTLTITVSGSSSRSRV